MRRLALLLVVAAACRSAAPSGGSAATGSDSPQAAVNRFLAAASAQDVQALGAAWGDEKGAARDNMERPQLEQRAFIMLCLLRHDQARLGAPQMLPEGRINIPVDLTQGQLSASATFTTARGPSGRWYVQNFDTVVLQNRGFCKKP